MSLTPHPKHQNIIIKSHVSIHLSPILSPCLPSDRTNTQNFVFVTSSFRNAYVYIFPDASTLPHVAVVMHFNCCEIIICVPFLLLLGI